MTKKQQKKFEIFAGILAGIGAVSLAIGAFNNWFVIVSYVLFLISAVMYIWWARKHGIIGVLIMNVCYFVADIFGIGSWLYNILN